MFTGHYAIALIFATLYQDIPIGHFLLSTQIMDILFSLFIISGIETAKVKQISKCLPYEPNAPFSHSLLGTLIVAFILANLLKRKKNDFKPIFIVVLSHWLLDYLVIPRLPLIHWTQCWSWTLEVCMRFCILL
jgi:membrane-bound metal-dependent hydrolase YbcI (DUF457 family)